MLRPPTRRVSDASSPCEVQLVDEKHKELQEEL